MCNCNYNCSCQSSCDPCNQTVQSCSQYGCPVQLDFKCVIYHKDNNEISQLTALGLSNGSTLELIIEAIDDQLEQLNVPDWSLPYLRASYLINSLQQFGEAVDDEFADIQSQVTALGVLINTAIVANDSATIDFTTSGTLNHTITASVKVSATAGNTLQALGDGLFVPVPTLSFNASTKVLTIVGGNSQDLSSVYTGFLGNVTSDPVSSSDGQYWFRTDLPVADGLRMKLNGSVRTIPTT